MHCLHPSTSVRGRDWRRLQSTVFTSLRHSNVSFLLHKLLRHLLAQVDREEALRQFDSMKLRPQGFENFLPLSMAGQTASWSTSYAMLAIQVHVERVECVAAGGEGDADGVVVRGLAAGGVDVVFGLVEFEADLRQVVEFGDGVAGDFGLHAALKNAVEEGVDVRLLGEVDE